MELDVQSAPTSHPSLYYASFQRGREKWIVIPFLAQRQIKVFFSKKVKSMLKLRLTPDDFMSTTVQRSWQQCILFSVFFPFEISLALTLPDSLPSELF